MTAKEYFDALRRREAAVDRRRKSLEEMRAALYAIGGFDYSRDRVQASAKPDAPFARSLQKIADIERDIDAELLALATETDEAMARINQMPNAREADALYLRHIRRKGFREMGAEMGCSDKNARIIYARAMENFEAQYLR